MRARSLLILAVCAPGMLALTAALVTLDLAACLVELRRLERRGVGL